MTNFEKFITEYTEQLKIARMEQPQEYSWPIEELPVIIDRMKVALQKGSYNKNSLSIKRTCKKLNIPYIYAGINAYIKG